MITINAVGDIMLGGKVSEKIDSNGADYLFDKIRPVISDADFIIGNLECPLSNRGMPYFHGHKDFIFRASPDCAQSLKKVGFNIACIANNHISDFGPLGLSDTIKYLNNNNIYTVGAGNNVYDACRPLILKRKGIRIAFLAFTYASRAKKNRSGCCPSDDKLIKSKIKQAKLSADIIVVLIHHGVEYVDYPNRYIMSLFRDAAESGADLILGHHPHVIQGVEHYKNSLIVYSLGNFISSYIDEEDREEAYRKTALTYFTDYKLKINDMRTTESFIFQCSFKKSGIDKYNIIPIKSNKNFQPEVMDECEANMFLKRMEAISCKFSDLNDPIWDEMDNLWIKCRRQTLKNISMQTIIKRIYHIRLRHLKLTIPYIKSKFSS